MDRIRHHAVAVTAFACALALPSVANAQSTPHYCEVVMDFSVNRHDIAQPRAIVELGKEAEITIGNETHGWQFRILVEEPTVVRRATVIPTNIELYELINGEAILRASPHIAVAPGQHAELDVTFGEEDGRKAHLGLSANFRTDAEVEAMQPTQDDQR